MGIQHPTFSRYARFIEVPLAAILLGLFIFFGIQYRGLSSYSIHQGDAPLDIQAARGQNVDITIVWTQSINGLWATGGLDLGLDGQNTGVEIVPPKDASWGNSISTQSSNSTSAINIDAIFSIPNYAGPVSETLTGTIQGQITYPQESAFFSFQDVNESLSLPVRLHLIPAGDVLLKQVSSYAPAILLLLLLGAGAFLRRRQVRIEAAPGATACARCRTETWMGRPYPFYFGSLLSTLRRNRTITRTYRIAGSQQVYFCDRCVSRKIANVEIGLLALGGIATLVVLIVGLTSLGLTSGEVYFLAAALLLVATGYFVSLVTLHKFRVLKKTDLRNALPGDALQDIGGQMAITINRKALQQQGYNAFFSSPAYRKLNRTPAGEFVRGR